MELFLGGPEPARSTTGRGRRRRRWAKGLLVAAAVLAALFLTVTRQHGLRVAAETSRAAPESGRDYDLTALRVFSNALVRAKENYADPTRIDPRAMLLGALDYVQRFTPEVVVDQPSQNQILVRVDAAERAFPVGDVDSPWMLSGKLKEIFRFIQAHVHPGEDMREIEYAATNGMLSTLDSHSVLLPPEVAKEMELSTTGEFGGLGIVIGIRNKGKLTILNPIKDTPAHKAGLKKWDHIVKINEESTVNMTLTEAVGRLRGQPGTKVTVWIERKGEPGLKKHVLTRAIIEIQSVEAHLLKGNVGYLHIKSFQGNTDEQLAREMERLAHDGARSYLLDLRANPGGLLEQAVKVADAFVDSGTIVATVGMGGRKREEQRAQAEDEPHLPMAVLVNSRSASASEIVAGALKNLDRAVVLGQTTFGKGSVQVLYNNDDGSKLKLTVAQYLTPGDVSIQAVGISPDLTLVPAHVEKGVPMRLFGEHADKREGDIEERPLRQEGIRAADKPTDTIRYLADARPAAAAPDDGDDEDATPEEDQDDELDTIADDVFVEDAEIRLARDLLAQAAGWRRSEVLSGARAFLARRKQEEAAHVQEALGKLGVDWSVGPVVGEPRLDLQAAFDPPGGKLTAGDKRKLVVTVHNAGKAAASQVHAISRSDNKLLDGLEFAFGKLGPGESRSWSADVKVPRRALSRVDTVWFELGDASASNRPAGELRVEMAGLPRPLFAYGYQVLDTAPGSDGDGLIQKGERIGLRVDVNNTGVGPALDAWATIKNLSGDGIFIYKGRSPLGRVEPGQSRSADFELEVQPRYGDSAFRLELAVYDESLGDFVTEKLDFPLVAPRAIEAVSSGFARTSARTDVRAGADAKAPAIGALPAGAVVAVTGRAPGWVRADLGGRPGFLPAASVVDGGAGPASAAAFLPRLQVTPPVLKLTVDARTTRQDSLVIRGSATDDRRVADVFAMVRNPDQKVFEKKVFYKSYRNAADPKRAAFEARIPLWPGQNYVTVIARENDEVRSSETVILTREGVAATARALPGPRPPGPSEEPVEGVPAKGM
jgi:carboxyl-terminal processing protease